MGTKTTKGLGKATNGSHPDVDPADVRTHLTFIARRLQKDNV